MRKETVMRSCPHNAQTMIEEVYIKASQWTDRDLQNQMSASGNVADWMPYLFF